MMRVCERLGVPQPVVCQPYYNLLNRMPEVEVLPACEHYGVGVASYSPIARGVLTAKYASDVVPEDSRAARKDRRMMQTEFREESFEIAKTLKEHAARTRRSPVQFALAWLWANRVVTSVIAGPRTFEQWQDYVSALGPRRGRTTMRSSSTRSCIPGIRRRRGTAIRRIRSSEEEPLTPNPDPHPTPHGPSALMMSSVMSTARPT